MLRRKSGIPVLLSAVGLAVLCCLAGTGSWAQGTQTVAEVVITGNQNVNADTIRNAVALKPGDQYTEEAVEKDRAAITSLGYFSAVTVHKPEETPAGLKITYEVTEFPKITDIKVTGSDPIPAQTILDLMKTKPGQVLNINTINQDTEAIQTLYGEERYIGYVAETEIDPNTAVLTVPIVVSTVESVEITGNKKTKPYVFLREMKTQPGTVFNYKTLSEDVMRIYNLDIIESVNQYQIVNGSEMGKIKLTLPVTEKKTGQVSLGLGYSSRQRLVGQARLSETNFRGKGQGLNVLWEQGTSEAVGGSASYELGFFEPWLDKRHTSLSVNGYNRIVYRFSSGIFGSSTFSNDQTYNERHRGGDVTLSRPVTETTRVYLGGRYDSVLTDPSLLEGAGDLYKIAQDGDVTCGSLRVVHNTRDFELDPAAGGYEGLSIELGSVEAVMFGAPPTYTQTPFNGAFRKASIDVRRYFSKGGRKTSPTDKRVTLAMRLRVGLASGKLPFFEQFFVGGSESLRGYQEDRFWGDRMLLASIEVRKPIAQSITGVVFVDYGDAWNGNAQFDIGEMPQSASFQGNFGVGVGMRVSTPIGHLRLDYGVGSEGGRTHFSMGHAF